MKRKFSYPAVVVEWDDAVIQYGDAAEEPEHAPLRQTTLGWLVKQDKSGVTIAMEYNSEGRRDEAFIPAGMVVKVTEVK